MAKAKFPGKPPKTSQITRFRVSSNTVTSVSDSSRFAAQQAAYGLKLFNQHFAADEEDNDDFIGFEKVGESFRPHFQPGTTQTKLLGKCHIVNHKPPETVYRDPHPDLSATVVNVPALPVVLSQDQTQLVANRRLEDLPRDRTSLVNWKSSELPCYQQHEKLADGKKLEKKLQEKSLKQVQPLKAVSAPKIPVFPKIGKEDQNGKRDSSEESERCHKSRPSVTNKTQSQVGEESAEQEKNRIKREIERYTTIMTNDVVDPKQAAVEKKKSRRKRSPCGEVDKAEKLRDKIQQLLRKQWESRLQLVDVKTETQVPLESKTETQENRASSMSVSSSSSSSEDDLFYKRRRMNSNSSSSSSARKSKIILRKARLQLNQKLLKQLRQPSRLQQLVEPKPEPAESHKIVQPSSTSILRPAQLVLKTATNPVPRIPALPKELTTKLPKVRNPSPAKSNCIQRASETPVTNPLGCAFVMEQNDSKGIPGTVVCGVCGAVRRYSFILQARKFGTFSCEPCRKFISRVLRARVPVKCAVGSGHCIQPPVHRSNTSFPPEEKPNGEVMTARCKACWLKLALTGFQMREADHDDLRKLLPAFMQDAIPLAVDRPTVIHWAPNRGQMIRMKSNASSTPNVPATSTLPSVPAAPKIKKKPNASKKGKHRLLMLFETTTQVPVYLELNDSQPPSLRRATKQTRNECISVTRAPPRLTEHCPGSRTREKNGGGGGGSTVEIQSGPRVKHVCRSAIVARAQPRATFDDGDSDRSASKQCDLPCDCCSLPDSGPLKLATFDVAPILANGSSAAKNSSKLPRSTDRKNSLSSPAMPLTTSQGERSHVTFHDDVKMGSNQRVGLMTSAVRAWQQQDQNRSKNSQFRCMTSGSAGRKAAKPLPKGLLLPDLWEHYDADRVWDQGFAMCCSRLGMTSPLCFLCGSSGRNELVSCSSCCECFHPFCVADSAPLSDSVRPDCHHWDREAMAGRIHEDGIESRCMVEKGETAISSVINTPGAPWICLNCVVCQICSSSSGQRMVCSSCSHAYHWSCLGPAHPSSKRKRRAKWQCFACSRVEEKFCPLCFKCHTSRQMKMECNCCGTWVHAECEQLSDEDFRFLCTATNVEYVCSLCSPDKNWKNDLLRCANGMLREALAKIADMQTTSSSNIFEAINDKVIQNEYRDCAELCTDIRQLADKLSLTESTIFSLIPWMESKQRQIVPRQKISITAKVEYDAESDIRLCALCHGRGEGPAAAEGRLLYCGSDIWCHINCALWSNEVFEEVDGALQNVFDALARGSGSRCKHCHAKGATVNCCVRGCQVSLHFPCCLQSETEVTLLEGKRLICSHHAKEQSSKNLVAHPPNFEVARCVYVDLGAESKRIKPCVPRDIRVVIGSLSISSIGQLRTDVSGENAALTPVGFECQRRYWSVKEPWKVVSYTLRTIYIPSSVDGKDLETNVTVSHEEEDVIMAESGLNLAELDTQDDRELIHMVLEDANFEQELEGGPNASVAMSGTPNELRDSGFYSDAGEVSPSPTEDNALEAWLADPEHAVIFLDSALLASLDIESDTAAPKPSTFSGAAVDETRTQPSNNYPQLPEVNTPPKRNLRNRRLSYTQWRKMRLNNRNEKRIVPATVKSSSIPSGERSSNLDWNGNESEWNSVNSNNLLASIKVSPLSHNDVLKKVNSDVPWHRKGSSGNILQLDGAADSSDTESEKAVVVKQENIGDEEPVKCRRCRRSYRTLQSFNKHVESCVEMLSSSSDGEEESEEDVIPVKPKLEPVEHDPHISIPIQFQAKEEPMDHVTEVDVIQSQPENDPIQVPVVNSSSQGQKPIEPAKSVNQSVPSKPPGNVKPRYQKRRFRPVVNAIPPRTLAIRQPHPPAPTGLQNVRFTVPAPSPIPASYQVALQSPPPPVLYVTRPELNPPNSGVQCGFISQPTLNVPQQHYIIMPPSMEQTFVQANSVPTLSSSGLTLTQQTSSPVVQYLGAIPSHMLSTLGIMTTNVGVTNYTTIPSLSTLLQNQHVQVPWETSNQIVILPQQSLLSFNLPSVSLQPASQLSPSIATIQLSPAVAKDTNPPSVKKTLSPKVVNELTAKPVVNVTKPKQSIPTPDNTKKDNSKALDELDVLQEDEKRLDIPLNNNTVEEVPAADGKPPKPTYSYRSAMGGKKPARIITPVGNEAKEDPPSIVQHLKVVAHPSAPEKATRTFHLKASSDQQERLSITEAMVEMVASQMTEATPELPNKLTDISDVFATPPASSEPPILPSDMDAEPVSWPVIDSTLPAEEQKSTPENGTKKEAHIVYELVSDDGFYARSNSLSAVWQKLLDAVQDARLALKMEPLYNGCTKSIDERNLHLTGLHHHAVINLLEQLPNADQFPGYTFRYRANRDRESVETLITGSTFGCVRAAPFNGRVPYDMFGWLASQYRPRPQPSVRAAADQDGAQQPAAGRRVTNFELLPMTVRFKHLRQVAKSSVGVYRSHIHGRGLFCKRDIECGEMVVEYAGQVIRSVLCDKREKEYEAKGMGCYMFRIDEQTVVDATVHGNAARFINHSCEPNCYSRIVDIFGKKHIIIFALRRIQRGEELTYDYKFPLEDVKIRCTCGSRKCRKYLN